MEEYPTIPQPHFLEIPLYEHQKTTVYRMMELEREKKIQNRQCVVDTQLGILGDEPGYGKTLSVCTLIAMRKLVPTDDDILQCLRGCQRYQCGPFVSVSYNGAQEGVRSVFLDATLVVCSTSIMSQWEKTLGMIRGRIRTLRILTKGDVKNFPTTMAELETKKQVVVLCSDKMYNTLACVTEGFIWKRFVFDEPASIHIPSMKPWKACFSWFVTATYHLFYEKYSFIKRAKSFLKSVIAPLSREVIDALVVKNPIEYLVSSQDLPHPIEIVHRCFENAVGGALQSFIPYDVQEMIAAGNITGAISALGGDVNERNVYEAARRKLQKRLSKARGKLQEYGVYKDSEDAYELSLYEKWRDVKAEMKQKILLLEERMQEALESNCPICCCELTEPCLAPCCQHIFCAGCIVPWLTRNGTAGSTCPTCRAKLSAVDIIMLSKDPKGGVSVEDEDKGKEKQEERVLTKIEHVEEIIKDESLKILIFSSHESSFEGVENILEESGIQFGMIKGHKGSRERVIREFMTGKIRVLLMNAKYNASGIDLQEATDVVLLHSMQDYVRKQAVGRAQRLGRRGPVRVHTFIE